MISECSDRCIMLHPSQIVSQGWKGLMSAKTVHGFKLQSHYCKLGSLDHTRMAGKMQKNGEYPIDIPWYPMISHDIPIHGVIVRMSCQTAMGTLWGLWKPSGWPPAFWFEMLQWGSWGVVAPVEFWPTVLASSCLMCSGQGRIRSNICNVD